MTNLLDKAIGYFSPKIGAQRAANRRRIALLEGTRRYEAAGRGRISAYWHGSSAGADAEIGKAGQRLRDRSRDLVRNNPLAAKIVTSHANNITGFGIRPRAKVEGDGKTKDKAKKVNELFDEWSKVCITGGAMDFYGAQYMLTRMMVTDGEAYLRKRSRRPSDGLPVPLQLQILDSEYCDWSKTTASDTGHEIRQGVEFDLIGNRAGYWMFPRNPKDILGWGTGTALASKFIPASDVAHIYRPDTNQVHGVPWMAPVMNDIDNLADYELSENIRKKTEAAVVGLVIPADDNADDPNIGLLDPADGKEKGAPIEDFQGNPFETMEPGSFAILRGGKDVKFNTPAISAGIEAYIRTRHRTIAAGVLLPYELLTGDFSQANFASGKLGLLEYQTFVSAVQWHFMIPPVLQQVWEWFIAAAKDAGKIPRAWKIGVEWNPPEVESITRLDDARADLIEMRMGKRSPQEVIGKTGRDPKEVLQEIDEWNTAVDQTSSKVILDSDPRKVTNNGQFQMEPGGKNGDGNAGTQ
ncbi:lambda family phage portal protein [Ancylobacter sp. 3268]|uniref:phage portal protein n=1 Tax=Ancylobacter sp. 3268 TaxID=2817752 RepID=UPI00285948C8|nr:phage portal protein [Ancylobacter sp. 3268]MDR6954132.1 lambda family phage portal protein [Ancylobacter sp. 3268]